MKQDKKRPGNPGAGRPLTGAEKRVPKNVTFLPSHLAALKGRGIFLRYALDAGLAYVIEQEHQKKADGFIAERANQEPFKCRNERGGSFRCNDQCDECDEFFTL